MSLTVQHALPMVGTVETVQRFGVADKCRIPACADVADDRRDALVGCRIANPFRCEQRAHRAAIGGFNNFQHVSGSSIDDTRRH